MVKMKRLGGEKKKMNTIRKITALLMASVIVMMVAVPMAFGDDAQTSADVTLNADPVVDSVEVLPDPVDMNQHPDTTPITVTATVSHDNGYEQIATVNVTSIVNMASGTISGLTLPVNLPFDHSTSDTQAVYTGTIELPPCTPPQYDTDHYTLTVTADDKKTTPGEDTGTDTFEVNALVAITVTNVPFGPVNPGSYTGKITSTVTNKGNVEIEFVDNTPNGYNDPSTGVDTDGITWSAMTSGVTNTIPASNVVTDWNKQGKITCGNTGTPKFTLSVPLGTPPGVYSGMITFTPSEVLA
jgi:hypothetical protein